MQGFKTLLGRKREFYTTVEGLGQRCSGAPPCIRTLQLDAVLLILEPWAFALHSPSPIFDMKTPKSRF